MRELKLKKLIALFIFSLLSVSFTSASASGDKGTTAEAMAMLKKAETYIKKNGVDKFLQEVGEPKGQFRDRDLYLSIYSQEGVVLAHGFNPKIVNKNVATLVDPDGKPFMKEILDTAKSAGAGKVEYKWPSPDNKTVYQDKIAYFQKVNDVIISCGIYK